MITCKVCNPRGNGYCAVHSTSGMAYEEMETLKSELSTRPSIGGIMDFTVKTKEPPAPKGRTNPLSPDYPHY